MNNILISANDKIRTFIDSLNDAERLELYNAVISQEFARNIIPEMKKQHPDIKLLHIQEGDESLYNGVRDTYNSPQMLIPLEAWITETVSEEISELMNNCNTLG